MNSKEAFQQVLNKVRNTSRWYEDELKLIQQDLDKLEKLEKVIEKIKNLPNCDICDANWHKGCMCLQRKIKEVLSNER